MTIGINIGIGTTSAPAGTKFRIVVLFEEYPDQMGRVVVKTGRTETEAKADIASTAGYVVPCRYLDSAPGTLVSIPFHRIYAIRMEPEV